MATKIPPGRARFRIGGVSVPLWLPTRAERIARDIARQKNAEFLASRTAPGTTVVHGLAPEEIEAVRGDIDEANGVPKPAPGATHGN